jgi:hypothetical protein
VVVAMFSRPTACSTAHLIQTTVCPITSLGKDKFSHMPCTSTTLTSMECAATNYCSDNGDCIFRDDHLYPSGLIVTLLLAVVVAAAVGSILYFCIRDKVRKKRDLRKMELEKTRKLQDEAREIGRERAPEDQERDREFEAHAAAQSRRAAAQKQGLEDPFGDR